MATSGFERVHDRIFRVPAEFEGGGLVNLYLIRGHKTAVVDSGVLGTPTTVLAPAIQSLGMSLDDIDLVINTHGHMDHMGGNGELKDAGAEIALHRDDVERAQSNRLQTEKAAEGMRAIGLDALVPEREAFLLRLLGREVAIDRVLEDGDVVDLGADVRLRVVHTPGHTVGSCCFWWESEGILLTGDSIQARGSRLGGLPVVEEPSLYPETLEKARSAGARTLLMGHAFKGAEGDLGPVASGARVAEVFRESQAIHDALLSAVRRAHAEAPAASAGEVARRAVDSLRESYDLRADKTGLPPSAVMTLPGYLAIGRR